MARYLVRARPKASIHELRSRLDAGEIQELRPFGIELQACLNDARVDEDGWALWEEQCFCTPPLKQEREVLDLYFTNIATEPVDEGEGWSQIADLPMLWENIRASSEE